MAVKRGSVSLGTALGTYSASGEREHLENSVTLPCSASCVCSAARLPGSATVSDTDALINKQQQRQ